MQSIKLSYFLKLEIKPFLLGAFISRIMETEVDGNKYFYCYSSFKTSHVIFRDDFSFKEYSKTLVAKFNKLSGHYNWCVERVSDTLMELRFNILNDLNMPKSLFYKTLYNKTLSAFWIIDDQMNDSKKDFIRGFIELRGSVDTNAKFLSQDYFYDNRIELKKAQILTDHMGIPIKYANFNARNLQPQYVSGARKRNTQFRINVFYYAKEIGFINEYKAEIFNRSYKTDGKVIINDIVYFNLELPVPKNDDATFIKYINFFTDNIYEKKLTPQAISLLRQKIGFTDQNPSDSRKRNMSIIDLYNEIAPDECAICGTTKTFLNKNTGRQHFEVHHVISFCNGKEVDNIANLVKLCPTCHDMLKKNRAPKEEQLNAIRKILHNHQEIYDFTSSYLGIDDFNELVEKIWELLG